MTWVNAVPEVLACVGLFLAPGLLATYLGGLRGITAWATAPLVTVAVVMVVAVAGGWFGFRFGVWPVAAGTVAMAALAAGLALLLRARGVGRPPGDPGSYSLAVVAGAVVAAVIGGVTFIRGVGRPDAISETWDAVYHYNAVRYIEQTGKASPLTIGLLGQPGSHARFYPDAWHALTALLAELTGASIPVAATVTGLVFAVVVWPLGCLLLARHLFGNSGRGPAAVVITGLLSSLFGAFPWMLTGGWGVLWPNALGMALAPAGVALGLSITGISAGDTFGAQRWLFGAAAAWAIGIAHPNAALSVGVICLIPVLIRLGPYVARQYRRRPWATSLAVLAVVAVAVIGAFVVSTLPPVRHVAASSSWPIRQTPSYALVGAFIDATDGQRGQLLLATFVLIGMFVCFAWRQRRWLVCAELVFVALYVGAATSRSPIVKLFTDPWYDDSHRLAATLPIVAIPLATTGVLAVGEWVQQFVRHAAAGAAVAARPALTLATPLAVGILLAAAAATQSVPDNAYTVGMKFSSAGDQAFTSTAKLQFLETIARIVPTSALVADDPYDGTAYLFTLNGTHVLFPQVDPTTNSSDLVYLARNLVQLEQNQRACDLVRSYGVGYMITAPDDYLAKRFQPDFYYGVANPVPNSGFRLMAAQGQLRLYKITICQRASSPTTPVVAVGGGGEG